MFELFFKRPFIYEHFPFKCAFLTFQACVQVSSESELIKIEWFKMELSTHVNTLLTLALCILCNLISSWNFVVKRIWNLFLIYTVRFWLIVAVAVAWKPIPISPWQTMAFARFVIHWFIHTFCLLFFSSTNLQSIEQRPFGCSDWNFSSFLEIV